MLTGWPLIAGMLTATAAVLCRPVGGRDRLRAARIGAPISRTPGSGLSGWGWWPLSLRRRRGTSAPDAAEVTALAAQLAALARAGLPPNRIWPVLAQRATADSVRVLAGAVVAAQRLGESTGHALLVQAGAGPDDPALGRLAVAVDVSERTGAGLAETLDRFADGLRADRAAAQERDTALAGPRATALILSLLPLAGLALGGLIGAHPWRTLVSTGPGRGCLLVGGLFWAAGRAWSAALVRRAEATA